MGNIDAANSKVKGKKLKGGIIAMKYFSRFFCMPKCAVFFVIIFILFYLNIDCVSLNAKPDAQSAVDSIDFPRLPSSFPNNQYTPFGYIDNPYHSMVFNRSGVLRTVPPLGMGLWRDEMEGSYGEGGRGYINYLSFLQIAVGIDGKTFADTNDFLLNNVELISRYHTHHLLSYDWEYNSLNVSIRYFLSRENTLACWIVLQNNEAKPKTISLYASNIYKIGDLRWWGGNGLSYNYNEINHSSIAKIWAYGDVFSLSSLTKPIAYKATGSESQWKQWIYTSDTTSEKTSFVKGRGPQWMLQTYKVELLPNEQKNILICLNRGKNEAYTLEEQKIGFAEASSNLSKQLEDDEKFWNHCPTLTDDWPESWKRGWVYDIETLRMTVRPPLGVFKHPWDGMQVHSPRQVLGETCIDMMTLFYGDPELAKDVIYGTFADAIAPNIPCAREDGSVNMISSDGSECGTAPMWGYPLHIIKSIYESTGDDAWIKKLYPYLKNYLDWWLKNRTDKEGWFHCNNSWESGQDGSRRFLVAEQNQAAVADFVRTVDVEASMAESMSVMEYFAKRLGKNNDISYWRNLGEKSVKHTQSMFFDGWFRDIDARTGAPIILKDYFDMMMLSPLTCNVATKQQMDAIRPMFSFFNENHNGGLDWPPGILTFVEAAWNAGELMPAAEVVFKTANRIYGRIDARTVLFNDSTQQYSYRIPGVANEFWPSAEIPPGGENYGWGATLPMEILRSIIGFREKDDDEFILAPAIPKELNKIGKTYSVNHLTYRNISFALKYSVNSAETLTAIIEFASPVNKIISVKDDKGYLKIQQSQKDGKTVVSFNIHNGSSCAVNFK